MSQCHKSLLLDHSSQKQNTLEGFKILCLLTMKLFTCIIWGFCGTISLSRSFQDNCLVWLIVWCFTPLSTIYQFYHGVYWESYPVLLVHISLHQPGSRNANPASPSAKRAAITTFLKYLVWPKRGSNPHPRRTFFQYITEVDACSSRRRTEKILIRMHRFAENSQKLEHVHGKQHQQQNKINR